MKKITFYCDNCGEPIDVNKHPRGQSEPFVTYESWRYNDAAGSSSGASNQVHICGHCARSWLTGLLTGRTTVEQAQERFASQDKNRIKRGAQS